MDSVRKEMQRDNRYGTSSLSDLCLLSRGTAYILARRKLITHVHRLDVIRAHAAGCRTKWGLRTLDVGRDDGAVILVVT